MTVVACFKGARLQIADKCKKRLHSARGDHTWNAGGVLQAPVEVQHALNLTVPEQHRNHTVQ